MTIPMIKATCQLSFKQLTLLKGKSHGKSIKVAHEIIPPIQLEWIKDFLVVSEEYKTKGTMHGKIPDHVTEDPDAYRAKLRRNHAENLALWMLENGFNVIPIESPDVRKWMMNDSRLANYYTRQALTAIRRDIYGLQVLDQQRPDIIIAGNAHVLKYDILLGRNGDKSTYYMEQLGDWNDILDLWQEAHGIYKDPSVQDNITLNQTRRWDYHRLNIFEED